MANPFDAAEVSNIYQIFGLPETGVMTIVLDLSRRPQSLAMDWEPTFAQGNLNNIITALQANLNKGDTGNLAVNVRTVLARYTAIGSTSQLVITKGATGSEGQIVHFPKELKKIRKELGNLLGIWVPAGGFFAEATRQFQQYISDLGTGDR